MSTAQTGRTHDLHPTASKKPKKSLDPWAPSTHDPHRTSRRFACGRDIDTFFGAVRLAIQKMAYTIQAILAKAGVLRPAQSPHLKIVNLKQGIDMVPLATSAQNISAFHFAL